MTVAPVTTETAYLLTGTTTGPFATVWPYAQGSDVQVWLHADGMDRQLASPGDFTLASTGPLLSGGDVTLLAGPTGAAWDAGDKVTLVRVSADGQAAALGEVTGFSPKSAEDALDAMARQIQDLRTRLALETVRRIPGATAFDAGSHPITGLISSNDPSAAATVEQLLAAVFGSSLPTFTAAWTDITGKPATFPASPMPASNINDIETAVGAKLEAGANITITHIGGKYRFIGSASVASVNGYTGAVNLKARDITGWASLKDYGGVCDGTTDDTAAWTAAIAAINAGTIGGLFLPGWSAVAGALPTITKPCALLGAGRGLSGLIHASGGDVTMLTIDVVGNALDRQTIADMTLCSRQLNQGQALYLRIWAPALMRNVDVMQGDPISHHGGTGFNRGIETVNINSGVYENVNFYGYVNNGLSFPANQMATAWAWYVHADTGKFSINCRFVNCDVNWTTTAWKGRGHLEGYTWLNCAPTFIGQPLDIQISDATLTPYFAVINMQCEYYNNGVVFDNAAYIQVLGSQFFADYDLATNRYAVTISNSYQANVAECMHVGIGAQSGTNLGTNGFLKYLNTAHGLSSNNFAQAIESVGVYHTGTSTDCKSRGDKIIGVATGGKPYKNDAGSGANLLSNNRRGMVTDVTSAVQGPQTVSGGVGSTTISSTQTPYVQLSMGVEPGDLLEFTFAVDALRDTTDTYLNVFLREYAHRPASGTPFQVLSFALDRQTLLEQHPLTTFAPEAIIYRSIRANVIAGAFDAVFSLEAANGAGTAITMSYAQLQVERL